MARPLTAMAIGIALAEKAHRLARHAGRALPAGMGRRAARPHHGAAVARGNQRSRNRWRHSRTVVSLAVGRPRRPAGVRDLARRAHVVRQRFRIERARLQARARARRILQRLAGQHAARGGHRRTRHRHAVRATTSTSGCGAPSAREPRSCSSTVARGMPAAHCCWRATARDMLRVLNLLGTDGVAGRSRRAARGLGARDGARVARECRNRHAAREADIRRRRSARRGRRQRQRVLGDSAAAARHPEHRESRWRESCPSCRRCC